MIKFFLLSLIFVLIINGQEANDSKMEIADDKLNSIMEFLSDKVEIKTLGNTKSNRRKNVEVELNNLDEDYLDKICPADFGMYADFDSNCKMYYVCNRPKRMITVKKCPKATVFDNHLKKCSKNGNCIKISQLEDELYQADDIQTDNHDSFNEEPSPTTTKTTTTTTKPQSTKQRAQAKDFTTPPLKVLGATTKKNSVFQFTTTHPTPVFTMKLILTPVEQQCLDEFRTNMLVFHNQLRVKIHDSPRVDEDSGLDFYAQQHAQMLALTNEFKNSENRVDVGENLYVELSPEAISLDFCRREFILFCLIIK